MKGLILVAHGSRLNAANNEVLQLADTINRLQDNRFQWVKPAFLEIGNPSVQNQITNLVAEGCHDLILFPFFLSGGKHVREDLPAILKWAKTQHPKVNFELTSHLGQVTNLATTILDSV